MNPAGQPAGQPAQPRAVGSGRLWAELHCVLRRFWMPFLLKSSSKATPAALGGCGGLGQLWEALAQLGEAL